MRGSAFKIFNEIIPFGNTKLFMKDAHDISTSNLNDSNVYKIFALNLNPIEDSFDPISSILCENNLNLYMNNLVSLDSIGIKDGTILSDSEFVEKFHSSINLLNGKYHVEIPWYPNKIRDVRGNFLLCSSILNRVYMDMQKKNLVSKYNEIFQQYLDEDIIEIVQMKNINYDENVFIPHHPVFKCEKT